MMWEFLCLLISVSKGSSNRAQLFWSSESQIWERILNDPNPSFKSSKIICSRLSPNKSFLISCSVSLFFNASVSFLMSIQLFSHVISLFDLDSGLSLNYSYMSAFNQSIWSDDLVFFWSLIIKYHLPSAILVTVFLYFKMKYDSNNWKF